ncbi:hypothetical protein H8N03_14640 [Ramlibacter sp. USB13]|uniref:Uncharacterized protein n=1 Tax=Ramlibacter cellulosilyticus TaxID=2764187 RepID=A0A923MSY0_9BURK|nr:hypothetical protein [Ramlibacter cellulosilyticus]MBC5784188.1 hypothetical protein [Ramlibacter cellulosilyticus]
MLEALEERLELPEPLLPELLLALARPLEERLEALALPPLLALDLLGDEEDLEEEEELRDAIACSFGCMNGRLFLLAATRSI